MSARPAAPPPDLVLSGDVPIRPDGLQLDEARAFQRRFWRIERGAWALFGGLVVAGLLGLTGGGGWLQRQTIAAADAAIDAPRIARRDAADEIRIRFAGRDGAHELGLSGAFLETFEITEISPPPEAATLVREGQRLAFPGEGQGPHEVILHLRAPHPGRLRARLTVDGAPAAFTVFVLP